MLKGLIQRFFDLLFKKEEPHPPHSNIGLTIGQRKKLQKIRSKSK